SPDLDRDQIFLAVRAHRANKARLDNIESVRAHLTPAATTPESVAGQSQFKMRAARVARRPRRFVSYRMQNGGPGANYVGENAEGFFILVKCLDAARAEVDEEAGTGAIVRDGGEARCFSVLIRHLCLRGGMILREGSTRARTSSPVAAPRQRPGRQYGKLEHSFVLVGGS